MKNRIISSRLWIEGLRRLRLPGFISLAFIGISAMLVPAARFIEKVLANNPVYRDSIVPTDTTVHPGLYLLQYVVVPIMVIITFSFLNKRRTADFYHALPYTRICTIASLSLSSVRWVFLIALTTSALNLAAYAVFGIKDALLPLLRIVPQILVGSLLMCVSVTLAMTLTGTVFSNLTVSALILFFPRITVGLFAAGVVNASPVLNINYFPVWRFLKYNLAVNGPLLSIDGAPHDGVIAIIYSLVLAVVYYTFACVFFSKRKSETAGTSAPNKAVQTVFRIAVTMVICMPVCAMLLFDAGNESLTIIIPVLFLYTVALTVWILWELITTKRWINVLKSLPYLGIVVVLNVAVVLGMFAARNAVLNFTPEPEEIKSVTVLSDRDYNYLSDYDMLSYAGIKVGDKTVTNENSLRTISGALSKAVDSIKRGVSGSYESEQSYYVSLRIDSTRGTRYRELGLTAREYNDLEAGFGNGPFEDETKIPETVTGNVNLYGIPYLKGNDTGDRIISIMRNELKEADADKWHEFLLNVDYNKTLNVTFRSLVNDSLMTIRIPMNRTFFPEASDVLLSAIGDLKDTERDEIMKTVEEIRKASLSYDPEKKDRYDDYSFNNDYSEYVIVLDKETGQYVVSNVWGYSDNDRETVIGGITDELPEGEQSFYIVTISSYDRVNGSETEKTYVSALTDKAAEVAAEYSGY